MNLALSFYELTVFAIFITALCISYKCACKKKYKLALLPVVLIAAVIFFQPIRMVIDTDSVHGNAQTAIEFQHRQTFKKLPPKFIDENKSYQEILKSKTSGSNSND